MKIYLILILILLSTVTLKAQSYVLYISDDIHTESDIDTDTDSINSVNLINNFYHNQASLSRTYDYELLNKKRKYEKWGKDIQIFGYGVILAISFVGGDLAYNNHWSLGWYLPTAVVFLGATSFGVYKWAEYYTNKAASIQLSPIYSYQINDTFSIQAMTVSNYDNPKDIGFGIGFTTKF